MTSFTNVEADSCGCEDLQVEQLRDLIVRGYGQVEASRALWGPHGFVSTPEAIVDAGRWARSFVRSALAARIPDLRLPADLEVS